MKRVIWLAFFCVISLFVTGFSLAMPMRGRILPGVTIAGIGVGGLTPAKAEALVRGSRRWKAPRIEFGFNGRSLSLAPEQIGIAPDIRAAVKKAYAVGRTGSPAHRMAAFARHLAGRRSVQVEVAWKIAPSLWEKCFSRMALEAYQAPRNAHFDLSTGSVIAEAYGQRADEAATSKALLEALRGGRARVPLVLNVLRPVTTRREIDQSGLRFVLAHFATSLEGSDAGRAFNVALAASRLNGILVAPGAEFSFNGAVGVCDAANGFRPALEIINRRLVPGVGGGVCQVASTMYNAVLLSGLPVIERRPHSLLVAYVPPGRDSTVYYGRVDLRFRNTTGGQLLICAGVAQKTLFVSLVGSRPPNVKYTLTETVTERIEPVEQVREDPGLEPGTERIESEGAPGLRVEVWRTATDGTSERISDDFYQPQPRIVFRPQTGQLAEGDERMPPGLEEKNGSRTGPQ